MIVSVVIPVYNEQNRIKKTLLEIENYFSNVPFDYEIIVVDDGSSDNTINVVENSLKNKSKLNLLTNVVNRGKGYSVKRGMLASKGELVLFTDADLSTPISELNKFFKFVTTYPVLIGSRSIQGSQIKLYQPFYRRLLGKTFINLVKLLAVQGISDTQCGFKLFRRDIIFKIFSNQKLERFGFDVEILYLADKLGYKIKEIPVVWINSTESKVNPVFDSIDMFLDLIRIRINILKGKYNLN